MKNVLILKTIVIAFAMLLTNTFAYAQKPASAGEYLSFIGKEYDKLSKDMWKYTRTVAHSKSARKVDNSRKTLIESTIAAKNKIAKMSDFEGDASFRDAVVEFLILSTTVLQQDYGKIMDMEEVAEQSYDAMEAYLLAQKIANQKLEEANKSLSESQKKFAAAHNVNLLENTSETEKKMDIASQVFDYYNEVYLIFFKSYKQEAYLLAALDKQDVNGMSQNKAALIASAEEGLSKLDTMRAFKGDKTILMACQNVLKFYLQEAVSDAPVMVDYLMKQEQFNEIKTSFNAKAQNARTKDDVDQYNKMVADMNAAVEKYNATNAKLNPKRAQLIDEWNAKVLSFTSKFVPAE